jgi:uncharacterized RDD family membrane protein YckC
MHQFPTHRENPGLYGGFWKRAVAWVIDHVIRVLSYWAVALIVAALGDPGMISDDAFDDGGPLSLIGLFLMVLFFILYHPVFESSKYQASPGKLLLGIEVVDMHGQRLSFLRALGRNVASILSHASAVGLYFGYWMAGLTPRKQALHDLIASCLVVNKNARPEALPAQSRPSTGFPTWAIGLIVTLALSVPVLAILAVIAMPAYTAYSARNVVNETIADSMPLRQMLTQEVVARGRVAQHEREFGGRWPGRLNDGLAEASLVDGTLLITFGQDAPAALRGETIGMAMHELGDGLPHWQCGLANGPPRRLSGVPGAELTTVDSRYLPAHCR